MIHDPLLPKLNSANRQTGEANDPAQEGRTALKTQKYESLGRTKAAKY